MALQLYNTMGRAVQEFVPIAPGKAGFYGCGPTVYNYAHIGNLRAYVFQDVLYRTLVFVGYVVRHVMNVTDIGHLTGDTDEGEDKMVKTARERGQSVLEIAQFYTDAFFRDTDRLNIKTPTVVCKATDHIQDMIDLIERLEKNGHTYMSGGNLYFDVSTFPDYGKLARLNLHDLKAGARTDIDKNKRNPFDFVLWFTKSKFENQALVWDSPWGTGYPGWHIECSAMSMKYLGEQFDIHTGGIDHIPVHHTNEIAQSEGATGKKWVNYWLHNEFLVIAKDKDGDDGKMSKSSGNFLTLQTLIDAGYDPLDYRFFLLGAHYRSQIAFSWDAMDSARNSRKALVQRIAKIAEHEGSTAEETEKPDVIRTYEQAENSLGPAARGYLDRFRAALEQDLATPRALSELQTAVKDHGMAPGQTLAFVRAADGVLGLSLMRSAHQLLKERETQTACPQRETGENAGIEELVRRRAEAKKNRDYDTADSIRNTLKEKGIVLEDTPEGTIWKRI